MSQDSNFTKSPRMETGQNVASVGFIGAYFISLIESFVTDAPLQKTLMLGVPFFTICFTEACKWIWGVFRPQNAEKIKLRFLLNKKQKAIELELKNPNLSEAHKKSLQEKLDAVSSDRINSFDP